MIRSIERLVTSQPFKGVNIDFEQIKPVDRDAFNQFIKELSGRLKPSGFTISIAVPAKQGDRSPEYLAAYDYATLGATADHVFLMTYDWHWPGGPPGRSLRSTRYALLWIMPSKRFQNKNCFSVLPCTPMIGPIFLTAKRKEPPTPRTGRFRSLHNIGLLFNMMGGRHPPILFIPILPVINMRFGSKMPVALSKNTGLFMNTASGVWADGNWDFPFRKRKKCFPACFQS